MLGFAVLSVVEELFHRLVIIAPCFVVVSKYKVRTYEVRILDDSRVLVGCLEYRN